MEINRETVAELSDEELAKLLHIALNLFTILREEYQIRDELPNEYDTIN